MLYRLGIIGTGRITDRFVKDAWQQNGFDLVAVYNPHLSSAEFFVEKYKGIKDDIYPCDDMSEFLKRVDAVYIASPHQTHFLYAKTLLQSGKHVLCEKPMSFNPSEVRELFALARKNKVVLMEALKTAYCPGFQALLEVVRSGKIGEIVEVESCFTKLSPTNTREWKDIEAGGSVSEMGTYVYYPVLKLLGTNYQNVSFLSHRANNGIDTYTKTVFDYGEKFASCKTGIGVKSEGQMIISGTKGYIVVEAPWWMTKSFEVRYEDPNRRERFTYPYEKSGLQYETEVFRELIQALENSVTEEDFEAFWKYAFEYSIEESITMAEIMERFFKQEKDIREKGESYVQSKLQELAGKPMKIWGHRGCSMDYPENTLEAFIATARLDHTYGIELDVQLTKDGEIVVFHDENVSRVTNGKQKVVEYTLEELKELWVAPGSEKQSKIPTLEEVLIAMKPYCESRGFMINIELKTSVIHYEGIEEKADALVRKYGLQDYIVYSSFWAESCKKMKEINPNNKTGMLATYLSDCIKWGRYAGVDALHPSVGGMDCDIPEDMKGFPIRAWGGAEPFYQKGRKLEEQHMEYYRVYGVTEIITNIPEYYQYTEK